MSTHIISATEASRSLSLILNKVHYQGEIYEIKRGKEVIAKIIPVAPKKAALKAGDLKEFFSRLPHLDKDDQQAFEKEVEQIRANMTSKDISWD